MENLKRYIDEIFEQSIERAVFSKPDSACEYRKIVLVRKKGSYQLEKYTQKQVFHENIDFDKIADRVCEIMENMKALNAFGESEYSLTISKKGKILFSKRKPQNTKEVSHSHNREKNYILKSGEDLPALIDMGIFTKDGKVVNSMYDKYRQINRFVELIDDAVKDLKPTDKPIKIIDFGCGKSYLTFILYHYFVNIRGLDVQMTGLDLKADVIEKCNAAAKKYGYENLHFEMGDIKDYSCDGIDMVITLHACDTATDYALFNAIRWGAQMIFSVPCCQHEINAQIKSERLSLLTRYGIVKERVSALITDAVRANLLEYMGYKTNLLEFVDFGATPKNILIRAVKKNTNPDREKYLAEATALLSEFSSTQKLYELLELKNVEKD